MTFQQDHHLGSCSFTFCDTHIYGITLTDINRYLDVVCDHPYYDDVSDVRYGTGAI